MTRRWTAHQDETLKRLYPTMTSREIAKRLRRTVGAVTSRAYELGLRKHRRRRKSRRKPWTRSEIRILIRHYRNEPTASVAQRLGRSVESVSAKAGLLNLRKSAEYMAGPGPHKFSGKEGIAHRFKPGHKSWNAGMKGWKAGGRSAETRFTKGSKPHTWVPVGTEVVDSDGYRKRKVRDDAPPGMSRRNWKFVHVLVWEEANGPVPPGHIVIFRDRDKTNIALDNLELITRVENMRRNTLHNYPKPIAKLIQLRGALNRQINRREKHQHEKQDQRSP